MKQIILFGLLILLLITSCTTIDMKKQSKIETQQPINQQTIPQTEQTNSSLETAYFAGGCFWCVEADFEKKHGGIKEVISGYMGGTVENPKYEEVSAGETGHRESVEVIYDPKLTSYQDLLDIFWHSIDPTDADGSFVDRGFQYSSAIFYKNENEKKLAEESKKEIQKKFDKPIATAIIPATEFYVAEEYHQDYYKKNPLRYKYYRGASGRDQFIEETWGKEE